MDIFLISVMLLVIIMVLCISLITRFPQIVTVVPDLVMGKEK